MAKRVAEIPAEKVELWSGQDVNLSIPTRWAGTGIYATATANLGDLRAFLRAAQDAGYDDTALIKVGVDGLSVRRDGRKP